MSKRDKEEMSGELVPDSSGNLVELTVEQRDRKNAYFAKFNDFVQTVKHRLFTEALIGKPQPARSTNDIVEPVVVIGPFESREENLGEFVRLVKAKNPRGMFPDEMPKGCTAAIIDNAVRVCGVWSIEDDGYIINIQTNVIR